MFTGKMNLNINISKFFIISIFIIGMIICTGSSLNAVSLSEQNEDTYILDAENINFNYQQNIISAAGAVRFQYKDLEVQAGQFILDLEKKLFTAEGDNIILKTAEEDIRGSYLKYNYETEKGTFYGASSHVDDLNFAGGVIELTPDHDYKYQINQARLTPCILSDPHYQIKAESIQIYPGEKILARQVQFWWGQQQLITLPYYVLQYRKIIDETGKEKEIIINPLPVPRLGYDSRQGLIFKLIYPYYLNQQSEGEIIASTNQQGEGSFGINNSYRLQNNIVLENELKYEKNKEDASWQQITDLTSYLKYKKKDYQLFTGFHYVNEEEKQSDEENIVEQKKMWEIGLNYDKDDFRLQTQFGYNLNNQDREEIMEIGYNLDSWHQIQLYHKYLNENYEKRSYLIKSKGLPFDWELKYREGYEVEYYPYLTLHFPVFYDISTVVGAGKVSNEGVALNRARIGVDYSKSLIFTDNLKLDFHEELIYNLYEWEQQNPSNSQIFTTEITGKYQKHISETMELNLKLYWQNVLTDGQFLLEADKAEEKSILGSGVDFTIATPQPQSAWNLQGLVAYDLNSNEWESVSLGITRSFDCYSLSFNYNPVDDFFGFNFEL